MRSLRVSWKVLPCHCYELVLVSGGLGGRFSSWLLAAFYHSLSIFSADFTRTSDLWIGSTVGFWDFCRPIRSRLKVLVHPPVGSWGNWSVWSLKNLNSPTFHGETHHVLIFTFHKLGYAPFSDIADIPHISQNHPKSYWNGDISIHIPMILA